MIEIDPDLTRVLEVEVGNALRTVASYQEREYEFHHLRTDIQSAYSRSEVEEILDDLIVEGIAKDRFESLFHAGEMECAVYGFEEAAMFHFIVDDLTGLFVSIDRDAELNLDRIISVCKAGMYV